MIRALVTIHRDVPVTHSLADLERKAWDVESVQRLFGELEFKSIGRRLFGDQFEVGGEKKFKTIDDVSHEYDDYRPRPNAMSVFQRIG